MLDADEIEPPSSEISSTRDFSDTMWFDALSDLASYETNETNETTRQTDKPDKP